VGCSREMVTRQLNDLQEGGYIRTQRGGDIVLLKSLPPRW
jgi:CRP-like cAMP-binding protein